MNKNKLMKKTLKKKAKMNKQMLNNYLLTMIQKFQKI